MSVRAATVAAVAALGVLAGAATASARPVADGGGGSYSVSGTSFDFVLDNSGTTSWQDFVLVGPPGAVFLGAATQGEITAPCSAGQPDGTANELECGPLSTTGLAPGTRVLVVAAMASSAACGQTFQLEVSSTGSQPYTGAGGVSLSGSCAAPAASTCEDVQTLVGAQASVSGLLAELSSAPRPRWAAALSALDGAQTQLQAALALHPTPPALARLRSALAAAAQAQAALQAAARQAVIVQAAATASSRLLDSDRTALHGCSQAGAAVAPALTAASPPACTSEQTTVAAATAADRMLEAAGTGARALARIAASLRAASVPPGNTMLQGSTLLAARWRDAARGLRRAAAAVTAAAGHEATVPPPSEGSAIRGLASAALATCKGG